MNGEQNDTAKELLQIVKMNGGGNFTASVYLREDGFFILFNEDFLERIARAGHAERFSELLEAKFREALKDATKESKRSGKRRRGGVYCGGRADCLPGVPVGN